MNSAGANAGGYHCTVTKSQPAPIPVASRQLDNGLRVTASHDPLAPGIAVNLWYGVGSADDPRQAKGFAHLFEHLMFAGSAHVADGQHGVILESLGGMCNATTSADRTNYFETVPLGALDLALWLEADRLSSLRVSRASLNTQRFVVREEKRQRYDNQPYGDQWLLLLGLGFPPDHPYATPTIGSMSDLDAASLNDVRAFHATWYRPSNAHLVVVSPLPDDEIFRQADKYLSFIDCDGASPIRVPPPALPPIEDVPRQTVTRPVPRSVLHLIWRTPPLTHPDRPAVGLALDVLASGQACRLHRDLVRGRGLSQAVGAPDTGLSRGTSLSGLSASPVAGGDLAALEQAMLEHLEQLAADGPTEAELSLAKAQIERDWSAELAGLADRADAINEAAALWGRAETVNDQLDRWLAPTAGDIAAAAHQWLHPDNRAVLEYLEAAS